MKKRFFLLSAILTVSLLVLCSCASHPMAGDWLCTELGEGYEMLYTFDEEDHYQFTCGEDFTLGRYEYKDGILYMDGEDMSDYLTVKGNAMIMRLEMDDGEILEYTFYRQE